jgi:predicted GIY-YIG superfamily endonuclease
MLADPRDGVVRYVGCTVDPEKRLYNHCRSHLSSTAKGRWCGELKTLRMQPIFIAIMSTYDKQTAAQREFDWIKRLKSEGYPLLNARPGGGIKGTAIRC